MPVPNHVSLAVIYRPIADLKPNPRNPRIHSPKQVKQIAKSIETFGFVVPILLDANGMIVAGHGRLEAGRILKLDRVPTLQLDHLTDAQVKAFVIADNR